MSRQVLFRNTALLTLADLAMRSVTILFQSYLSKTVGAADMGKLQLIGAVRAFSMTVGLSGIRVAVLNLTAERFAEGDESGAKLAVHTCMRYTLFLSLTVAAVLFLSAPQITQRWIGSPQLIGALRIAALELPICCLASVCAGYFIARGKIGQTVIAEVADRLCSVGFCFLFLRRMVVQDSAIASCCVLASGAIGSFFGCIILFYRMQQDLRKIKVVPGSSALRPVLKISIPLAIGDYLRTGLTSLKQFLIPYGLRKSGASYDGAMRIYGTIGAMVFPVLMFPAAFIYALCDLLISELSRCKAKHSAVRIRYLIGQCLKLGLLLDAAVAGLMYLIAKPLGILLYQSEEAGMQLRLFSPMIVLLYTDALADGMLKGLGEQVATVKLNTATSLLDIILLFTLLPKLGIRGYYITFLLTHTINFAFSLHRLCVVSGYKPHWKSAIVTLLISFLSVLVCRAFTNDAPKLLSVFGCALVYLGTDFLFLLLGHCLPIQRQFGVFSETTSNTVKQPSATRKRISRPANAIPYGRSGFS